MAAGSLERTGCHVQGWEESPNIPPRVSACHCRDKYYSVHQCAAVGSFFIYCSSFATPPLLLAVEV